MGNLSRSGLLTSRWLAVFVLLCTLFTLQLWPAEPHARPEARETSFTHEIAHHRSYGNGPSTNHTLLSRDDYSCSASNPCPNGACCGASGYCGYGPTYCSNGCVANCDAQAECGQYAPKGKEHCPLNVWYVAQSLGSIHALTLMKLLEVRVLRYHCRFL